jgi:hypothetical protein
MRKLTPRRRIAAALAAVAGASIALSPANLFADHPNRLITAHAVRGLLIGISLGMSIGILIRNRRSCSL